MRVAVQMDPILEVDRETDTTYALMEEAQKRGFDLFVFGPEQVTYHSGQIFAANAYPVEITREADQTATLGSPILLDLKMDLDIILMRQDPPFDMAYLTTAHLLEMLEGHTVVINNPFWVRSSPEKIIPLLFPDIMPPTLVSRDLGAIKSFQREYKDIIVKPLNRNGGAGVFRLREGDSNLESLTEIFFETSREPLMVQAFLRDVKHGDKRVILINGEAVGAINRVPQKGHVRANVHVGGTAEPSSLTAQDLNICEKIGPTLKERGLILVGIDVIGGYLTEINSTSPTCVQELKKFSGVDAAALFWDVVVTDLVKLA